MTCCTKEERGGAPTGPIERYNILKARALSGLDLSRTLLESNVSKIDFLDYGFFEQWAAPSGNHFAAVSVNAMVAGMEMLQHAWERICIKVTLTD